MKDSTNEAVCTLCGEEKLTFVPPPIYCSPCGGTIKRNDVYYSIGIGDTRQCFCVSCYKEASDDTISFDGLIIPKHRLVEKNNDEEFEEWWIQCSKCEDWQHQICALFNGRVPEYEKVGYLCRNCQVNEPLPQSAVLGAENLPRTVLSDYLEKRLFEKLRLERLERAKAKGKRPDQVPGAEELVIRVVSSADKTLKVKQRFMEIFEDENYPTDFPYKSKVILVFQKIEGVEVCHFGMYVQEFGSEAQFPNQRRVYLAYMDFVPYFRPKIKTVAGEDLSTFVYHEILIGYLEYCKKRGFTSCSIWASRASADEDDIFYRPPGIQDRPKSDELRNWYLTMLGKAAKENIVVGLTNLYDQFFVSALECNAKITAARLPYFDHDYFPGAAEDFIYQNKRQSSQSGRPRDSSDDLLLMQRLGEIINPMKKDFIMVHLQHACSHCCTLMVSGHRWVCDHCPNFQLCDTCYETELKREGGEKHPVSQSDEHTFHPVEINDVPADTRDEDGIIDSEFFEARQTFLSLCHGNHYQFDTLRRAKHSSMMILYHLHNPTAPAYVTSCSACSREIETGQGWRCDVCPEYALCNACYQKDWNVEHSHELTNQPIVDNCGAQTREARQIRVQQLKEMLDLFVHTSLCRTAQCESRNCRKVKGLYRHGIQCATRASGGCVLCKRMWYLLQLHARSCEQLACHVPRCRDLYEHTRKLKEQYDTRRRAAVMKRRASILIE